MGRQMDVRSNGSKKRNGDCATKADNPPAGVHCSLEKATTVGEEVGQHSGTMRHRWCMITQTIRTMHSNPSA